MNDNFEKYRDEILKSIENKDIKNRIEYLLNWYSKRAKQCKRRYYVFASVGIIGPTLVTLISSYKCVDLSCLIPIISAISSICAGILVLTRWQEGWIRYRETLECIQSEINNYLADIVGISNVEKIQKDRDFVKNIEKIVLNENKKWSNTRTQNSNNSQQQP